MHLLRIIFLRIDSLIRLQSIFPKINFNKNEMSIIIKLIRDERKEWLETNRLSK